ncbi:SLC13 family permease [Mailhella massiliensis]|uniref:SLC13 family permease n=1 Tax=Mailhella massiliensis TaxID=1903261 RepID=UPI00097DF611|nr:SLC13 family permease [Mailhella massiliensis]
MKANTASIRPHLSGILSGPLLCFILLACPAPASLGEQGMKSLAAIAWIIMWWMTEAFPLSFTALFGIVLYGIMGVLPLSRGFAFLSSPTCMLLLGSMLLLGALKDSNLIERYTYKVVTSAFVAHSPTRLMVLFGMAAGLLSAIMPNIPVAILFTSIAVALGKSMRARPGHPLIRAMVVASGVGASVGGTGTPVGGVPNLLVIGIIASSLNYQVQFWEWSAFGMALCIAWLAAMVLFCHIFFLRGCSTGDSCFSVDVISERLESLGPVTIREKASLGVLIAALLLWCLGQPMANRFGIPALARLLDVSTIAVLCGVCLLFIPTGRDDTGRITFVLDWKTALASINWEILIFVSGVLAFGQVCIEGGIDKWLAGLVSPMLEGLSPSLTWLVLLAVSGILCQWANPATVISLLVPTTALIAAQKGINPIVACFTVGMVANLAIMFPFSSPPIAASILGSDDYASPKDFFRFSFPMVTVCVLLAWVIGMGFGPVVFPS